MPLLGYWKMSLLAILRLLQAESPRESLPYPESEGLRKSWNSKTSSEVLL